MVVVPALRAFTVPLSTETIDVLSDFQVKALLPLYLAVMVEVSPTYNFKIVGVIVNVSGIGVLSVGSVGSSASPVLLLLPVPLGLVGWVLGCVGSAVVGSVTSGFVASDSAAIGSVTVGMVLDGSVVLVVRLVPSVVGFVSLGLFVVGVVLPPLSLGG
jgi:hypothetical protein